MMAAFAKGYPKSGQPPGGGLVDEGTTLPTCSLGDYKTVEPIFRLEKMWGNSFLDWVFTAFAYFPENMRIMLALFFVSRIFQYIKHLGWCSPVSLKFLDMCLPHGDRYRSWYLYLGPPVINLQVRARDFTLIRCYLDALYSTIRGLFASSQLKKNSCLQSPDCFMCWENCELLQANFQIWGSICETEICYPGCQEACRFHRESPQQKQTEPVIKARGEELLKIENNVAKWPNPTSSSGKSPVVYIVMRRNADSSWSQIIQTVERSLPLSENTITANLRVLVVNPEGLVTMYSPAISVPEKINESVVNRIMAGVNNRRGDKISLNTPKSAAWALKEVSLIHQKVLVLAEVSWEPRMLHAVYLVTWEVDGGGLKGNLFTDSTCVTLSLWPDTIYHIQVEVVSKTDKSLPLVLDTHKASQVSFDIPKTSENPLAFNEKSKFLLPRLSLDDTLKSRSTEMTAEITKALDESLNRHTYNPRKIFSSRKDISSEEQFEAPKANLRTPTRITSSLSSVIFTSSDMDGVHKMELVLGSTTAIVLFLLLCLLLLFRSRRKYVDVEIGDSPPSGADQLRLGSDNGVVLVTRTEDLRAATKDDSDLYRKSNLFFNEALINRLGESERGTPGPDFLKVAKEKATSEVQV